MRNRYVWITRSLSSGCLVFATHAWMNRGQMPSEVHSKSHKVFLSCCSSLEQGLWCGILYICSGTGGQWPERLKKLLERGINQKNTHSFESYTNVWWTVCHCYKWVLLCFVLFSWMCWHKMNWTWRIPSICISGQVWSRVVSIAELRKQVDKKQKNKTEQNRSADSAVKGKAT